MTRSAKILPLVIGLAAIILVFYGFPLWVFIPVLPAAIIFVIAVLGARAGKPKPKRAEQDDETDTRKAA